MTLCFYFDSSSCSGCKACQVACKDKNDLETGGLWRRVYEICGGAWKSTGTAWKTDVFAYNLSLACNHCAKPICVEVCPTSSLVRRPDGIVLLNENSCAGCGYCRLACPYKAPQMNRATGRMGKCDLCRDQLERGGPPACVASCPMRALKIGEGVELEATYGPTPSIHPLPDKSLTAPCLVITPHPKAHLASSKNAEVANWEEVSHD